jgi:orotidine-5'-phosphate decarboxylase
MDAGRSCAEMLAAHWAEGRHLTIGLDPDPARIPGAIDPGADDADRVIAFNRAIVEQTADLACAYKPNVAFYEALGGDGFRALHETVAAIRAAAPNAAVILDAKRADIGSTNLGYVRALFDELGGDAVTVHPYLGHEALQPFLERAEKLIFVLARTSNPGAGELQDLTVDGDPLYRHLARSVARDWNANGNCGIVVGATYPEEMREVRADVPPELPILIPGVGAQGGDVAAVVAANRAADSSAYLIAASRSIIYASSGEDFAAAARREAQALSEAIGAAAPA